MVGVPLMRGETPVGAFAVAWPDPGETPESQVELLKIFADQAVIAIENVRLFNEIQDKSLQLEVANRHKTEFLAGMSHELRTPLNAIIGFSEVLQEKMFGDVNDKQLEYLGDIHGSGTHLLSLINDILDLSKIEAGRMELDLAEFDLRGALQNAMTLIKERAQRSGISLSLEVDDALGAFRADERKFKQIMLNLLSNAVKFSPERGLVSIKLYKERGDAVFEVLDEGPGIPPHEREKIFEAFYRGADMPVAAIKGSGLGLSIVKEYVSLHKGRIEVLEGPGAHFRIRFPRKKADAENEAAA